MTSEHEAPNVQPKTSEEEGDYIDVTLVEETGEETANPAQPSESNVESNPKTNKKKIAIIAGAGGVALVAIIVILVLVFSGPHMPDLIGEKPYEAKMKLIELIDSEQIEFQTEDEIYADPEQETDYAEWEVVSQSIEPGNSIGGQKVMITIKPTDEYMTRRNRIINEFIDTQVQLNDWNEDEISYSDLGDVLIISFKSIHSEDQDYFPIAVFDDDFKEGQVQAEQLASSLSCAVVQISYVGDWLAYINVVPSSQSPLSAQKKAQLIAEKINCEGIEYAEANKEKAIENLKAYYTNSFNVGVECESRDGVCYIALICPRGKTWSIPGLSEEDAKERKAEGQGMCNAAALNLQSKVSMGFVEADGSVYETYSAMPTGFIFNKSSGKLE